MDFTRTEAQDDLGQLTRSITEKLVTSDRLRALDGAEDRFDDVTWRSLAESGVLSAALPETVGGSGFGILEQCSVLQELGRTLAAVPYLPSITLAASALAEFGSAEQRDLARKAALGETILTVALAEEYNDEPARPATRAEPDGAGWVLSGTKTTVPVATLAARLLIPASTPNGTAVFLIDPATPGVTITRQQVVDLSAEAIVELDDVRVAASDLVGTEERGPGIIDWLLTRAAVGISALQLGSLERALEMVSDYARERTQFDRPIGSFQAVAQRLSDAYIDVKGVRLAVTQAAWQLDDGSATEASIRTAKFWAADAGHRVAHTVIHVHGGVGLDRDHPVHRYFLAAKHNEFALGSATDQLRRLGRHLMTTSSA